LSKLPYYTFDAEGNITAVDGGQTAQYVYNAQNQRVRATVGSTAIEYVFNAAGQRVSEWNGTTRAQLKGKYYWGGKPVAYYTTASDTNAAVGAHFEHQDWLGTERLRTTYNGGVEGSYISLPFGDGFSTLAGTDADANHYATLDHDAETATDHAEFRQYSEAQGRWLAPDPYDGSYDASNPQSFNRYVYALNNPTAMVDPSGQSPPRPGNPNQSASTECAHVDGDSICAVQEVNTGLGGPIIIDGGAAGGSGYVAVTSPDGTVTLYPLEKWISWMQDGYGAGDWLANGTTGDVMAINQIGGATTVDTGYDVESFAIQGYLPTSQLPSGTIHLQQGNAHPADPILALAVGVTSNSGLYVQTPLQKALTNCSESVGISIAGAPAFTASKIAAYAFWSLGLGMNFVDNGCTTVIHNPPAW